MNRHTLSIACAALLGVAGAAQAQVAVRDAETGALRTPTPDEIRALGANAPAAGRAAAPVGLLTGKANPKAVVHADGSVSQELDTSSLMYSVVRRNADGTLSSYCVTGADQARKVIGGVAAPVAAKEHAHEIQ